MALKNYWVFGLLMVIAPAWGWNSMGHQVMATIAYEQLTPQTRAEVDRLTHIWFKDKSGYVRFMRASTWPDQLRFQEVTAFNHWHFINTPWSVDGVAGYSPEPDNLVWALQQSLQTLGSARARYREQAFFLAFFIHLVGDAHQPLHCINRYSRAHPQGDEGGGLALIKSPIAGNLHSYWDQGLGLFSAPVGKDSVQALARDWMHRYPPERLSRELKIVDPDQWVQESFRLAQTVVYRLPEHSRPAAEYDKLGQDVVARQIVLAGYRCAALLNQTVGG